MWRSVLVPSRIVVGVVGLMLGCSGGPSFEDKVRALAELPAATATADPELRDRIATLRQQRGGPDQIGPTGFVTPAAQNAAAELADIFSDSFRKQIGPRVAELADSGELAAELLTTHAPVLRRLEAAAALGECRFATDATAGYFARMRYLDDVALAVRFELLRSRQAAHDSDGASAMSAWRRGMRWCHRLAKVSRVSSRVLAATLRAELLNELALQLDERVYGRYEAEQVYGVLRDQLADWPSDRRMLFGDRAMVAHAYEALRIGLIDRMVTLEERKRLRSAGVFDRLTEPNPAALDRDEANYLAAMELLLDAAETPYHARDEVVWKAVAIAQQEPDLAAYKMFFQELPDAQLLIARDRSRCEAWCLALAAAADLVTPPFRTNPVNGKDYEAIVDQSRVVVKTHDPGAGDAVCPRFEAIGVAAR